MPSILSLFISPIISSAVFINFSKSSPDTSILIGFPTGGPFSSFSTNILAPTNPVNESDISFITSDVLIPLRSINSTKAMVVSDLLGERSPANMPPLPAPMVIPTDLIISSYLFRVSYSLSSTLWVSVSVTSRSVPKGNSAVT